MGKKKKRFLNAWIALSVKCTFRFFGKKDIWQFGYTSFVYYVKEYEINANILFKGLLFHDKGENMTI